MVTKGFLHPSWACLLAHEGWLKPVFVTLVAKEAGGQQKLWLGEIIFMSQTKNYDLVIIFWPTLLEKSLDSCSCMHASCTYSRGVAAVLHQQQSQQSSLAEQLLTGWCFYTSSQPLTWWCFYTSSLWWKRLQSKCKNTPSLGLSSLQAGITPIAHFTLS